MKFENALYLRNAEILPNFYGFVNIFRINKIQRAFRPDMAQQKYTLPQALFGLGEGRPSCMARRKMMIAASHLKLRTRCGEHIMLQFGRKLRVRQFDIQNFCGNEGFSIVINEFYDIANRNLC
ncbi:MAG: hypothetical protein LUE95_06525, partial [Oscillospiraceae bacterium]|nr:hypothetical protein [Oscillospiraceae bacterium]